MARVESFELDHNTVKAPYVRLAGTEQNGDALVEKYDLRFLQPNKDALPTGALHTLEHLLAVNMRDELKGIIDISPMGCRTGFYMIMWDQHSPQEIRDAFSQRFKQSNQYRSCSSSLCKRVRKLQRSFFICSERIRKNRLRPRN